MTDAGGAGWPGSSWRRWVGEAAPGEPAAPGEGVRLDWPGAPAAEDPEPAEAAFGIEDAEHAEDAAYVEYAEYADDAELLPAVPLLPAIAGRVDAVQGQLRALSMRLDVLASSIAAVRSALGDRIDGYAETAAATARQADQALEEHRRSTERAVTELRRGLSASDEVLRRMAGRVEEIATDVVSVLDAQRAPAAADDAVLDAVADVADRLAGIEARLEEPPAAPVVASGRDETAAVVLDAIAGVEDRLAGLEARVVQAAEAARGEQPAPPLVPDEAVLGAVAGIAERLAAIEARLDQPPAAPAPPGRDAGIERSLAELRNLVELIVDTMPASSEGSADRIDPELLAARIVEHLEHRFEIVTEDP